MFVWICFDAPPSIIEGHYVFWSVRLSRFKLKFLVKVVFDEVEVRSIWNLVHMFPMIWSWYEMIVRMGHPCTGDTFLLPLCFMYLCVWLFVHLSILLSHLRLKFMVKVVFGEVEVQLICNWLYMFPMIWSFQFNAKFETSYALYLSIWLY